MKKRAFLVILVLLSFGLLTAVETEDEPQVAKAKKSSFTLALGAGGRMFNESQMQDAYGKTNVSLQGEIGYFLAKKIALAFDFGYLTKTGKSSFEEAQENLKFSMLSAEAGPKIYFGVNKIKPFLGLLAGYFIVKEEAGQIGKVEKKQFGFSAAFGLEYNLASSIFLQLKIKYSFLKIETDQSRDLGGINAGLAVGFAF